MQKVQPIHTVDLFPQEREHLLKLFATLSREDWRQPTVCEGWNVRDIGLHLLADDMGFLSGRRDHFSNPFFEGKDTHLWENLVPTINESNELWVKATQRISPELLCSLLAWTGQQFCSYIQSLDQMAINGVVSWAGPEHAPAWLDTAREYTERWLHQQHIRDAVNQPGLKDTYFLHPILDTFVRALPYTYRHVPALQLTILQFVITGEAGDTWYLVRDANQWSLYTEVEHKPATVVTMDQDTCWRLFTKGISKEQARIHTTIEGNTDLGEVLLDTISIIA